MHIMTLAAILLLAVVTAEAASNIAQVTIDGSQTRDVSPLLFGAFFEEINWAGEGGLYGEYIGDRSFDQAHFLRGLVRIQGWQPTSEEEKDMKKPSANATATSTADEEDGAHSTSFSSRSRLDAFWRQRAQELNGDGMFVGQCSSPIDEGGDGSTASVYGTQANSYIDIVSQEFYIQPALNGDTRPNAVSFRSYWFSTSNSFLRINSTDGFAYVTAANSLGPNTDPTFKDDASFLLEGTNGQKITWMMFADPFRSFEGRNNTHVHIRSLSKGAYSMQFLGPSPIVDNCGGNLDNPSPRLNFSAAPKKGEPQAWILQKSGLMTSANIQENERSLWEPQGAGVSMQTTELHPLNEQNRIALSVNTTLNNTGIRNRGYWGIGSDSYSFQLTFYAMSFDSPATIVTWSLVTQAGTVLATGTTPPLTASWMEYTYTFSTSVRTSDASLLLTLNSANAHVFFDYVSLFNSENIQSGLPFRQDVLQHLQAMKPKFLRFPGGNYIEGQLRDNYFHWERTVGPPQQRPGHFNDAWGYWTTDGLGFFEFLQLCEVLGANPLWVVYNGCGLSFSTPPSEIQPLIEQALAGLEFAMGPTTSKWGSLRASMGHPDPFIINHMAIGNEDINHPFYTENYMAFYEVLSRTYPDITLIANYDMAPDYPVQVWDFHVYSSPSWFISNSYMWDSADRSQTPKVFNSEYATVIDSGNGNLLAALGEAVWMTGLERNSDLVVMASYAPLFSRANHRQWYPDAIYYNSLTSYGTPSYWTQVLFSQYQGATVFPSFSMNPPVDPNNGPVIGFSAVCIDTNCSEVVYKLINYEQDIYTVHVTLKNTNLTFENTATLITLTANDQLDENSLMFPDLVVPVSSSIPITSGGTQMVFNLQGWSINVIVLSAVSSTPSPPRAVSSIFRQKQSES